MRRLLLGCLVLLAHAGLARDTAAQARRAVYVIPIEGMIDMGLAPFVQRILDDATKDSAAAVILQINTFGGRVDAAVVIRDALLAAKVPTVAFINRRAISAGALISLAATHIAMTDGGTIGAATPVQVAPGTSGPTPVDEKSVSYVRKEFRATADSRKRPPLVAEAMVDADIAIPGVIDKGKLLTLTTDEALTHKIADFRANTLDEVLATLDLAGAEVRRFAPNWGERVVRLITHPIVASLLLSAGMLGILVEIRTPGFGVPGAVGLVSLALLLGGHWIVDLVGWEELLLLGAGLVLLGLEIFVLPGFGVAGILGFAALLAGLTMAMIGHGPTLRAVMGAVERVTIAMLAALLASFILLRFLPKLPFGRQLMLETTLAGGSTDTGLPVEPASNLLGREGVTLSLLRPAGFAEIDGERVDVVAEGEMIEAGVPVVVSRMEGNRIVVRRRRAAREETS